MPSITSATSALLSLALLLPSGEPNADAASTPGTAITSRPIIFTTSGSNLSGAASARQLTVAPKVATAAADSSWPGIYDLVAWGFPEGERRAVMEIGQKDSSFTLVSMQGPPGKAEAFQITGARLHVVWNLGNELMYVDLRRTRDSLTGEWFVGDDGGQVRGARRK